MAECIVGGVAPKNVYTIDGTSYSRILKVDIHQNDSIGSDYIHRSRYTLDSGRIVRIEIPAATISMANNQIPPSYGTYSMPYQLFKESGQTRLDNYFTITFDFQAGKINIDADGYTAHITSGVWVNIFVLDT